jgi:hypothetical protein
MGSVLLGCKAGRTAVAVRGRIFVDSFACREYVVKELDEKEFLGVAAIEGLAVGNPVYFGECCRRPMGRRPNVLVKGFRGGSFADNLFDL